MSSSNDPPPCSLPGNAPACGPRCCLAALMLLLWISSSPASAQQQLPFPLVLQDPATGGQVRLEAGQPATHLVFLATWCPACLDELPRLAELEARWGDRGYRLVLVAVSTRQSRERLEQLLERRDPPGRLVFDASGSISRSCGVADVPTHLLVDNGGRVVHRSEALDAGVERAVQGLIKSR